MLNLDMIKKESTKTCRALDRLMEAGQRKMHDYLSGNDADSSYNSDNVKNIITLSKTLDWSKVEDQSNALFNIGYSEQGNIIGILTNANALLQDMLLYCSLEEAKKNLRNVLAIEVGSRIVPGKRYAKDGKSPLTFGLPVVTQGGYKTLAVVIHNDHADKFIEILETLDVDALDRTDISLLARDISFISRTQELAIDVAKDKTIQIVDTSQWLNMGVKSRNYWLSQDKKTNDWLAKDNLSEMIASKKKCQDLPKFKIESDIPERVLEKVSTEVTTSESVAKEVLLKATEDYFNNVYSEMLLYSKETALSVRSKAASQANPELSKAIKPIIAAYRSYMIDNIPQQTADADAETIRLLNKNYREKTDAFAAICRNTIYKIGFGFGYKTKEIAEVAYGVDLLEVSINEGKFFRNIMPEEFKVLYADGKVTTKKEKLFYVDELTQDDIDEDIEIVVDFINGEAFKDDVLIAKASYKFNETDCKLIFDENTGCFYAEKVVDMKLPKLTGEVLARIELTEEDLDLDNIKFATKLGATRNALYRYNEDLGENIVLGQLGFRGFLDMLTGAMLLQNNIVNGFAKQKAFDKLNVLLNDVERIQKYNLTKELNIKNILTVNKGGQYEATYAIINL